MPEMQSVITSLVLNIANIVVLFLLLRLLVYKPVKKFMAARADGIAKDLEDSKKALQEAQNIKAKHEAELASATESAEAERQRILSAAENRAAEITAAAENEAKEIRSAAEIQAQHSADKLRQQAREEITDLAVGIAGRILEREVSKESNQDIIQNYFVWVV